MTFLTNGTCATLNGIAELAACQTGSLFGCSLLVRVAKVVVGLAVLRDDQLGCSAVQHHSPRGG
jgi:hypothetical protein